MTNAEASVVRTECIQLKSQIAELTASKMAYRRILTEVAYIVSPPLSSG